MNVPNTGASNDVPVFRLITEKSDKMLIALLKERRMVTLKISSLFTAVTTEEAAIVGGGSSSAIPINNIQNHLAVQKNDFGTANLTFVKLEAPTQTTDESLILQLHIG